MTRLGSPRSSLSMLGSAALRAVPLDLLSARGKSAVARLATPLSLPRHLAIIMDGNGRWAKARGKSRLEGHKAGANAAERILKCVLEMRIPYLTLFAFSSENWRRPQGEVQGLMKLLEEYLVRNKKSFLDDGCIRLSVLGDKTKLPSSLALQLAEVEQKSKINTKTDAKNSTTKNATTKSNSNGKADEATLNLGLALNYGGRDDLVRATRKLAAACVQGRQDAAKLTECHIAAALDTAGFPDPDLLIRTGGEQRISNFLLWQCAYTELMFSDCPWPDFDRKHLESMLKAFAQRERRFGTSGNEALQKA